VETEQGYSEGKDTGEVNKKGKYKKHLKNVGPIHQVSPAVLSRAACASMSTTPTTTQRVTEGTAMAPWNGPNKQEKKEASNKGNTHINNLYSA